jgi:hypothetical protein
MYILPQQTKQSNMSTDNISIDDNMSINDTMSIEDVVVVVVL